MPWLSEESLKILQEETRKRRGPNYTLISVHFTPGPKWDGNEESILNEIIRGLDSELVNSPPSCKESIDIRDFVKEL